MEGTVNHTAPSERTFQQRNPLRRILIAGIGNIFLGDDGFGVEVAQRLINRKTKQYPEGVQAVDFGICGIELAYTLLDDYDTLVLVDAVSRGGPPGTLYLIEPDLTHIGPEQGLEAGRVALDAHSMDPVKVLAFAKALGVRPIRTLLVGCEPSPIDEGNDYTEMQMCLSEPVQTAVDEAVKMIDSLVEELLAMKM
jgi:hydrogenase maturation protease